MGENDTPAVELNAPLVGDQEQPSEVATVQPEGISPADRLAAQVGVDRAFKVIREQPTERIRVHKDQGPQVVIINGARFNVPANVYVEVPRQVAQVLRDAERI